MYMNRWFTKPICTRKHSVWSVHMQPEPFLDPEQHGHRRLLATSGNVQFPKTEPVPRNLKGGSAEWKYMSKHWSGKKSPEKIEWTEIPRAFLGSGRFYWFTLRCSWLRISPKENDFAKSIIKWYADQGMTNLCTWIKHALRITAQVLLKMKCICLSASEASSGNSLMIEQSQKQNAEWKTVVADLKWIQCSRQRQARHHFHAYWQVSLQLQTGENWCWKSMSCVAGCNSGISDALEEVVGFNRFIRVHGYMRSLQSFR